MARTRSRIRNCRYRATTAREWFFPQRIDVPDRAGHYAKGMFSLFPGPPLPTGTQAPDFTLRDQDGNPVTLSKLRGRNVVLVFYPRDATPVCTKQLCEYRDESALTASKNTVVLGINPGGERSHAGFRQKQRLTFPLLVDEGSEVAKRYNAKGLLWTLRTVYLIDGSGVIRYAVRGKPLPADVLSAARV